MSCLRRVLPLVGVIVCAAPAVTIAQSNQKAEARRHYDRGLSLVKGRSFGEAIAEFNQSYDIGQDFTVLYEIGKAYIAIDQPVFAIDALEKYLHQGGKGIPKAKRRAVGAEVSKQQSRVATVTIESAVAGAVLRVDGMDMGKTPFPEGIRVSAGPHLFSASAEGYRPWEQRMEFAGGARGTLDIRLEPNTPVAALPPAPAAMAPLPSAAPPAPEPEALEPAAAEPVAGQTAAVAISPAPASTNVGKTVGYVLGGLGIAALAVGGVYGARAISKSHDSDKRCPKDQCSQAGVDLNSEAKSAARVADITIGVGLVSAVVATYLLLRSPTVAADSAATPASQTRVSAAIGPGEARLVFGGVW